jgi:putative transposase
MPTPVTLTTDGAAGLTKAIDAMWPKSLRIRCWFHKMQNLQQKVPAGAWPECKALVIDMRDAPTRQKAEERRDAIVARYQPEFPEACRCLRDDAEASLNHLAVPQRSSMSAPPIWWSVRSWRSGAAPRSSRISSLRRA